MIVILDVLHGASFTDIVRHYSISSHTAEELAEKHRKTVEAMLSGRPNGKSFSDLDHGRGTIGWYVCSLKVLGF